MLRPWIDLSQRALLTEVDAVLDAAPRAEFLGPRGQAFYAAHIAIELHGVLRGHSDARYIVGAAVADALSRAQAGMNFVLVALLLDHALDDLRSFPEFRHVIRADLAATLDEAMRDAAARKS